MGKFIFEQPKFLGRDLSDVVENEGVAKTVQMPVPVSPDFPRIKLMNVFVDPEIVEGGLDNLMQEQKEKELKRIKKLFEKFLKKATREKMFSDDLIRKIELDMDLEETEQDEVIVLFREFLKKNK